MILSRPSLFFRCSLLALLAGIAVAAGRAKPANATADPLLPVAPAAQSAPAYAGRESPSAPARASGPAHPVAETPAPVALPRATGAAKPAGESAATKVTRNYPNESRAEISGLQTLGISLTERGDFDSAEIAFRQIMGSPRANAEDLSHALLGLARVYRRQGSYTKAAAIYERFLKDYPADGQAPDALLEVGRTYRAMDAPQLALSRFYSVINSTLKLSSEGFEHYQVLAKTAQFEIAETHFQQGEYVEANKFFSRLRLLELAPADRARAHFKSAYALYLANDFDGAVNTLQAYLNQWPQDENVAEARYLLSISLRTLGLKQRALDATLELLRSQQAVGDTKRWAYWQRRTGNQLANEFFQAGDTHNALVIYQGLVALAPEPAWRLPITYQIGLCYERMRITDRATAAYQSIIDSVTPPKVAGEEKSAAPEKARPEPGERAKPVSPELTELARMAAWRISQIDWHDQTEHQLTGIFTTTPETAQPAPVTAVAPNIDRNAATTTLVNDHTGNPSKTPASL